MHVTLIGTSKKATDIDVVRMMNAAANCVIGGHTVVSGGAPQMDSAAERGVDIMREINPDRIYHKKIILPWNGFEGRKEDGKDFFLLDETMTQVSERLLEACGIVWYKALSPGIKKLYARNGFQILLPDYSKTDVVGWIAPEDKHGLPKGGTRIAVLMAQSMNIPTFNLRTQLDEFYAFLYGPDNRVKYNMVVMEDSHEENTD